MWTIPFRCEQLQLNVHSSIFCFLPPRPETTLATISFLFELSITRSWAAKPSAWTPGFDKLPVTKCVNASSCTSAWSFADPTFECHFVYCRGIQKSCCAATSVVKQDNPWYFSFDLIIFFEIHMPSLRPKFSANTLAEGRHANMRCTMRWNQIVQPPNLRRHVFLIVLRQQSCFHLCVITDHKQQGLFYPDPVIFNSTRCQPNPSCK